MIYLTGDTHGELDRFRKGKLRWLGKNNTVIVLGDFGFLWDDSKAERHMRKWLEKRRYQVLFLDGCHENFAMLEACPTQKAFGG
ncbi:MAG: calcineurin-like phosphoesterase, partial [Faecalibacterium sp.]|nr:calcineurin-like phosphoesterase [Faecalibacterium sp.]